jgi:hypothetical protein
MTQGSKSNADKLEDLETPVWKPGHLVAQFGQKVKVIEASIHGIEVFHPKIKIIRRPAAPSGPTTEGPFNLFAERLILKVA